MKCSLLAIVALLVKKEENANHAQRVLQGESSVRDRGGKRKRRSYGKAPNRPRNFAEQQDLLIRRWFGTGGEEPLETETQFMKQFRISIAQYEEVKEKLLLLDAGRAIKIWEKKTNPKQDGHSLHRPKASLLLRHISTRSSVRS